MAADNIVLDEITQNNIIHFIYLCSIVSSDNKLDNELKNHIAKASSLIGHLTEHLWKNFNISMKVKCKEYRAIVISTLLYGAGTWTVYKTLVKRNQCLCHVASESYQEHQIVAAYLIF
uniref:Uncharacterized protein n=1 Tax=Octopus bimaculoides TaxID=37653 RepID=A0A0L8GDC3_OCTBM